MKPFLKIEYINPKSLKFAKYNPRSISNDVMGRLKASITKFGIVDPFIVNKYNNTIIGGHMRCRVAIEMGLKEVPIVYIKLSLEKEKALNLTLNNLNIAGEFTSSLEPLLSNIKELDFDLYNDLSLDVLLLDVPVIDYKTTDHKDNSNDEWDNMPEYSQEDLSAKYQIKVSFYTEGDIKKFSKLINQPLTNKTRSIWFPKVDWESTKDKIYTDES